MFKLTMEKSNEDGSVDRVEICTSKHIIQWNEILPIVKQALQGLGYCFKLNDEVDIVNYEGEEGSGL